MNTPYVKQYDENGKIIPFQSPVDEKGNILPPQYISEFPNRKKRREKDMRFHNNRKTFPTVVAGSFRYRKRIQYAWDKENQKMKTIEHYDLVK